MRKSQTRVTTGGRPAMLDEYTERIAALGGDPSDKTPDPEWAALEAKATRKWETMTPAERLDARRELAAKAGKTFKRESDVRSAYVDGYCVERWGRDYRKAVEAERVEKARIEAERAEVAAKEARRAAKARAVAPKPPTARATIAQDASEAASTGAQPRKRRKRRPRQITLTPDGRWVAPIFDDDDL